MALRNDEIRVFLGRRVLLWLALPMDYLGVASFFAVTFGHCALMPWWVRRFSGSFQSAEEFLFISAVVALGSLQAVLHVLACTIGISLPAGIVALVTLHVCIAAWTRRGAARAASQESTPAEGRSPEPAAQSWTALAVRVPWLSVFASAVVVTIVLSWLYRAADSTQILGIDSKHYHVPYMVNYAHGATLFGFVATPHLYPVGASILGAWFFQAVDGPLLLDLVNLCPSSYWESLSCISSACLPASPAGNGRRSCSSCCSRGRCFG